jgi:uncharacterized protein YrrD
MIGDSVRNETGEDLGKLEELMLDLNSGRIAYAVLSFGGVLGLGDKLFAIPWEAFRLDPENEEFILSVDKEMLKDAPGFDKDDWPQTVEHDWLVGVYDYYGYEPYWR